MVETHACLLEKRAEDAHLYEQNQSGIGHHDEGIYCSLCHNGSQCFRERDVIITFQDTTSGELADAWNNQADGIRQENGIEADRCPRVFANGFQCLFPTPATEHLCQDTKWE